MSGAQEKPRQEEEQRFLCSHPWKMSGWEGDAGGKARHGETAGLPQSGEAQSSALSP